MAVRALRIVRADDATVSHFAIIVINFYDRKYALKTDLANTIQFNWEIYFDYAILFFLLLLLSVARLRFDVFERDYSAISERKHLMKWVALVAVDGGIQRALLPVQSREEKKKREIVWSLVPIFTPALLSTHFVTIVFLRIWSSHAIWMGICRFHVTLNTCAKPFHRAQFRHLLITIFFFFCSEWVSHISHVIRVVSEWVRVASVEWKIWNISLKAIENN